MGTQPLEPSPLADFQPAFCCRTSSPPRASPESGLLCCTVVSGVGCGASEPSRLRSPLTRGSTRSPGEPPASRTAALSPSPPESCRDKTIYSKKAQELRAFVQWH